MSGEFRSDGSPTKGYIVRDDELGWDEDVKGVTESTKAPEVARRIVESSRKNPR